MDVLNVKNSQNHCKKLNRDDSRLRSSFQNQENLKGKVRKVLLVGYNGANNTGSEARLISIINDVKDVLGPGVLITIPTLNEKNLRRYIKEKPNLKIVSIPSIFFFAVKKLVKEHDLVLLVAGSCYMDTWTSALLWAFLWATRCANSFKKLCIAYSVDAGDLSALNRFLVKREASKTDLIIARTELAADKLKKLGVTAPIKHTTDNAFIFQRDVKDRNILKDVWADKSPHQAEADFVGFAVVDFYLWPVVIRPCGRSRDLYKWPYYFSRSKRRSQGSDELAGKWAAAADNVAEKYGKKIALICMEELDEPFAENILKKMQHADDACIFSSREFNASQMTGILQSLELLVTSRYHASVLSLEAAVPQIAVAHDPRLIGLYMELEMDKYLYDYRSDKKGRKWNEIEKSVGELIKNPEKIREQLKKSYGEHLIIANENKQLLKDFLIERGWMVKP